LFVREERGGEGGERRTKERRNQVKEKGGERRTRREESSERERMEGEYHP